MATTSIADTHWDNLNRTDRQTVIRIIGYRGHIGLEKSAFADFAPFVQTVIVSAISKATKR